MIELRDYQHTIRDEARLALAQLSRRVLLVLPTGAGKTTVGGDIVSRAASAGVPALWLAHRTELIDQAVERLQLFGLEVGIIQGGREPNPAAIVQVASVASLGRRPPPPAGLIVVDEAHHANANSYARPIAHYPGALVLGLTATPVRLDGKGLGDMWGAMVCGPSMPELVAMDRLCEIDVWGHPHEPTLPKQTTEYSKKLIAGVMDKPELLGDIVEHWCEKAEGRTTVCFAASIEHSRSIVKAFQAAGVRAAHIDGETPVDERREVLARLRSGDLTLVSNYSVLGEGWDLPDCAVCICARPTASLSLWIQMCGRVARFKGPGVRAVVLDHAGNGKRHGHPGTARPWRLTTSSDRQALPGGESVHQCMGCFYIYSRLLDGCPQCGCIPTPTTRGGPINRPGGLVLLVGGHDLHPFLSQFRPLTGHGTPEERQRAVDGILAEARRRGFKNSSWAKSQYQQCFGVRAVGEWLAQIRAEWPDEPRGVWDRALGKLVYV